MSFGRLGYQYGSFGHLGGTGGLDLPDAPITAFRTGVTGLTHSNVNAFYTPTQTVKLPNGDFSIGIFFRRGAEATGGYLFNLAPLGSTVAQCVTGNNTLSLYETGSNVTTQFQNSLAVFGRDQSGNQIGNVALTLDGGANNCLISEQLEAGLGAVYLAVLRRRSGVTELMLCAKGQQARVSVSLAATWTGFSGYAALGIGGRSNSNGTAVYGYDLDSPFILPDYALTNSDIERIANGESPESMNVNGFGTARIVFASMSFGGSFDAITTVNPTNGQTITLNGDVWTFVTGTPTGKQSQIGASCAITIANLVAALNALTPNTGGASNATYTSVDVNQLRIQSNTIGGQSFTFSTTATALMPRNQRLSQVEMMWITDTKGSASGGGPLTSYLGGVTLGRVLLSTTWNLVTNEMAPVTPHASAVRIKPWSAGMVCQQLGGTSTLALSGDFVGNPPSNVQVQVIDLSNSSVVLAYTSLSSFTLNRAAKTWTGKLPGVPKGQRWLGFQTRKIGKTDVLTSEIPWGVGEVILLHGQSLQVGMCNFASTVTPNAYCSKYGATAAQQGNQLNTSPWQPDGAFHRLLSNSANIGAGEGVLLTELSSQLGSVVTLINLALGGTSLAGLTNPTYWAAWASCLAQTFTDPASGLLASYFCWDQGHADAGAGYAAKLDTLYSELRTNLGSQIKFVLNTLSNIQAADTADNTLLIWEVRQAQQQWLAGKTSDPLVLFGGDTDDYTTNNTDGIHPSAPGDYENKAERIALGILADRGVVSFNGAGPKITSVTRSGAVLTVNVAHNGGTALQSRAGSGGVTGFDVSADNFVSSLLTQVSAVISNATQLIITLSADPGAPVYVNYNWGRPGKISGDPVIALDPASRSALTQLTPAAQNNPVYDNRSGLTYNPTGLPLQFTGSPVLSN